MQVVPQRRTRSGSPSAYLLNRTRALPLHLSTFLIASLAGLLCTLVFSGCATNSITPYVRLPSKSHVEKLPFEVGLYLTDSFKSYDQSASVRIFGPDSSPHEMTIHLGKSSVELWTKGLANSFESVIVVSEHDESLSPGILYLQPSITEVYDIDTLPVHTLLTYDLKILASNEDVLATLRATGDEKMGYVRANPVSLLAAFVTFTGSAYVTGESDYERMFEKSFAKAQRSAFEGILEQLDSHRYLFETEQTIATCCREVSTALNEYDVARLGILASPKDSRNTSSSFDRLVESLGVHCSLREGISVVDERLSAEALDKIGARVSDANVANEALLYGNLTGADARLELRRTSVSDETISITLRRCATNEIVWESSLSLADYSD